MYRSRLNIQRRRLAGLGSLGALALALVSIATPDRVVAAVDCNAAALQNLRLPNPANPGATGWTSAGTPLKGIPPNPAGSIPEIAEGDQNDGPARGTAQLFTQQIGNVTCFYLRREFSSPAGNPQGTANGVLCFDTTDCSVCAWDKATAAGVDPQGTLFSAMLFTSSYGNAGGIQNCSGCHVSGPAMPMDKLYQQTDQLALMNKCVSVGGPNWVSAPAGWATQGAGNVVAPANVPATCGQGGCHTAGFLKPQAAAGQMTWCNFASQAFKPGGSMTDYSEADCRTFMDAVGCDRNLCNPTARVPALSTWGWWSLVVMIAAVAHFLIKRKQTCAWQS